MLKRWITKCKITHSLAFFQWRAKYEPRANLEELTEIFEDKIAKTIANIKESTKQRKLLSVTVAKPKPMKHKEKNHVGHEKLKGSKKKEAKMKESLHEKQHFSEK